MTVAELITALQSYPQDMIVVDSIGPIEIEDLVVRAKDYDDLDSERVLEII